MENLSRFPSRDSDFHVSINNSVNHLNTNQERLVLTPAAKASLAKVNLLLNEPIKGWNTIYPKSQNPNEEKTSLTTAKNNNRNSMEAEMRTIFDDIPESVLNEDDRNVLNLPEPSSTYTSATVPTEIPAIIVKSRGYLTVELSIVNSALPNSVAKPAGVDSIELEGAYLPNGSAAPPGFPHEADFRHIAITGKAHFKRKHILDQLQGSEHIRARYLNTKKEPGNWSEYIRVVIA